jgi:uncharacterized damage-inducible protein DinB
LSLEDNKRIREKILQSVSGMSDKQLNERVEDNSWTIAQVLEHLYLIERSITISISKQLENEESVQTNEKPIHYAVDRSRKIQAPSFVFPSDEYMSLEEIKGKLTESRAALINVVDEADESLLEQKSFPHLVFGLVSLKQWVPFIGFHEERHLAQIEEIKEKLKTTS